MEGKQTISELSHRFGVSESTIKRQLKDISKSWEQPTIEGSGYVHMDATYWGRSWGVLLALDEHSGFPLYLAFIENETASDYEAAIRSIEERGYTISGIIIDGKKGLFALFSDYRIQMCQFHMKQIIRRYLTLNPRLKAARELKDLLDTLSISSGRDFKANYAQWKEKWKDTLAKRSLLKCGKRNDTHKRLRSAMHSLDFYMPYLFTFHLTSSLRTPKIFVKEFSYFLMPCHQHCLGVNLLVQRQLNLYGCDSLCQCKDLVYAHLNL